MYKRQERDGRGGVPAELDPYFTTSEPGLGDEARIPPPLTLAGAKLQREWLGRVLFDSPDLRPYMHARMPRFGRANLAHLPELFARVDGGALLPFEMPDPRGEAARTARDAGRELMGIRGLSCISCHDFKGRPSPNHRGIDLVTTCERLQPSWFAAYLLDPQSFRPGTVMPDSWPGGVAAHQGILDGDTEAQIRALWHYLSQGRTARDPEGLRRAPSVLAVTDAPRLYRGRSGVAGFRGIAVGFPGGLSYAFDARTGSLAALWSGDFVSVRWEGQGAGDWSPGAAPVQLARDLAFHRLPDEAAPWPRLPPRPEGKHPVNPDPDYPRNRGYRFGGYGFDGAGVPTFSYSSLGVAIEDRSEPHGERGPAVLRRVLEFSAPAAERLYLRVLTGEFERVAEGVYALPRLRLRLAEGTDPFTRPAGEDSPAELLIRLDLPAGHSSLVIEYELQD